MQVQVLLFLWQKGFIPGIYLAIHTFGRDLKRNIHLHLSTTVGGLSLSKDSLVKNAYFYHDTLKKMWKYDSQSVIFEYLDPNLVMERIFEDSDNKHVMFFGFLD